jgi:hypothetical protein
MQRGNMNVKFFCMLIKLFIYLFRVSFDNGYNRSRLSTNNEF